jgi:hypothetical protein
MLLIIGKVVLGNLEEEIVFSSWKLSIGLRLPLDSLQKLQREIVVDRSLFEDLPALDDYDEK